MNSDQKILVVSWLSIVALILVAIIFNDWVMNNWDWLSFVLLGFVAVAGAYFGREKSGWGEHGVMFGEFIQPYPLLQLWMAVYTFFIALTLITLGVKGVRLHEYVGTLLIVFFVPLLGPAVAVAEIKRYKRLGSQSNKPLQTNAAKPRG